MAKAQYLGVGNVARAVHAQNLGVGNVARAVKDGFIGVANVARRFFESFTISFRCPSYYDGCTTTEEFAGFDGDTVLLMYSGLVRGSEAATCRMYIEHIDESYYGQTLSFEYKASASGSGHYGQLNFREADGTTEVASKELDTRSSYGAKSYTIPSGTETINIGWYITNSGSAEMTIRNMYLGDKKII